LITGLVVALPVIAYIGISSFGATVFGNSPTMQSANATMWSASGNWGMSTILFIIIPFAIVFTIVALYATYRWMPVGGENIERQN
jgi:ABC-type multidrug transport system permease subunit